VRGLCTGRRFSVVFTIFVKTKSLHTLAETVKTTCEGMLLDGRLRKVELAGENVKDALMEQDAIDVYIEVKGKKETELFCSVATINEELKVIYISDIETENDFLLADFIESLIVELLDSFGWDRVRWLYVPED